ncbi:MAG: hypothetical protein Q8O67_20630 [Deltaproteobacteria bacterium]|nr:hypothetical protein [Deltaproteobacteria bacterium]
MSFPLLVFLAYLLLGMGTTTALWSSSQDELDLAISMELDDEADHPLFRMLLTVFFVLAWPMVFWDAFSKR